MGLSVSVTDSQIKRKNTIAERRLKHHLHEINNKDQYNCKIVLKADKRVNQKKQSSIIQQSITKKEQNLIQTPTQSKIQATYLHQNVGQIQKRIMTQQQQNESRQYKENDQKTKQTATSFNEGPIQFSHIEELKQRSKKLRTEIKSQLQECKMNDTNKRESQTLSKSFILLPVINSRDYQNQQQHYQNTHNKKQIDAIYKKPLTSRKGQDLYHMRRRQ